MYEFSGLGHTIESRLTGTVFKILDTRQSEILIEFSRNIPFNSPKNSRSLLRNRLILLRIVNLCLQISSDFKRYLGFEIKEIVELGHTIKSRWS